MNNSEISPANFGTLLIKPRNNFTMQNQKYALVALAILSSCVKTIEKPVVTTVEKPIVITNTEILKVPEVVFLDRSVGVFGTPKAIKETTQNTQLAGMAVAKVMSVTGASGTGFFISKDGLFLTNEHVIPISSCMKKKCAGFKIVTGLGSGQQIKQYTDFTVLAQEAGDYDFTLLKVNLKNGETVDYLNLSFESPNFSSKEAISNFAVFGHPAGASLHVSPALPTTIINTNLEFKAVVIPGNSGGPLIDLKTNIVYGLVKSMRTSPTLDESGSTFYENTNHSTSIQKLNEYIKKETNLELLSLNTSSDLKSLDKSLTEDNSISDEDFLGALRRSAGDVRASIAMQKFVRIIGTPDEKRTLSLMLKQGSKENPINMQTLNQLFKLGLQIGRDLSFTFEENQIILGEINNINDKMARASTQLYYLFLKDKTAAKWQQGICLTAIPQITATLMLNAYYCLSNVNPNGESIVKLYYNDLIKSTDTTLSLDKVTSIASFLLMMSTIGVSSDDDIKTVELINQYIKNKNRDYQVLMTSDCYASGM